MTRTISIAVIFSLILISCGGSDDSVDSGDSTPPPPPPVEIQFLSFQASSNILNEIDIISVVENIGDIKTVVHLNWIARDVNGVILDNFAWLLPSDMFPGDVVQVNAFSIANYFQTDSIEYWVTWDDGICFDCGESLHYKISR